MRLPLNLAPAHLVCAPASRSRVAGRNSVILSGLISACLLALAISTVSAQSVDDHNPVGVTGIFNGNITTGCSYDPLTHSAHRAIDDIVVPGSIGKYPLKMTRYYNSRRLGGAGGLGPGWSHEYTWFWSPGRGKVEYPNGNVWENHCESPVGVSDWLVSSGYPYGAFRLADGGTVVWDTLGRASQIIDPYGQTTIITYTSNTTTVTEPGGRYLLFTYTPSGPQAGLLSKVEAFDGVQGHPRIDWVNYTYAQRDPGGNYSQPQYCLIRVDYSDGTSATYTYEQDNVPDNQPRGSFKFWPLLSTANDVRYHGPMRRIAYDYQNQGPHGAITAERYSASDGNKGVIVSSIPGNLPGPLSGGQSFEMPRDFAETRGDIPTRTFHYTRLKIQRDSEPTGCPQIVAPASDAASQFLLSYTDFQNHTTWLHYDANWYVDKVTDARGTNEGDPNYTTTYLRGPAPPQGIGQIKKITHPDTSSIKYDYEDPTPQNGDPHYVTRITDERGNVTKHFRDAKHRIYRTEYRNPGANDSGALLAYETFTYCDQAENNGQCGPLNPTTLQMHGQIKTHLLKNGAYVHYRYDAQGRGLLVDKWEPTWTSSASDSEPKTHYTYYTSGLWTDRVMTVTGPAPNWAYSQQTSETYEYDRALGGNGVTDPNGAAKAGRGLVTKITHADGTFPRFAYDAYGNKRGEDNELRNPTSYTYDEYNRLLNVTRPLNGITDYTYNPTNGSRLSHTTSNPDTVTVRTSASSSITTTNVYDENFRKTSSSVAGATTWFHYDNVGNQDYVTDPRGAQSGDSQYTTYTDFDARNRKWRLREPLGRTTQFYYDDKINVTRILRPDQTTETKAYDGMNRLTTDTVPKQQSVDIVTRFDYYPYNVHYASLLWKVTDGESHITTLEYDPSGLKTKMIYHDGSFRAWTYDDAHNLKNRTTVGGGIQNFAYDNRNRKVGEWWDGFPADGEWRVFGYDDAGRLTLATNGLGDYWTNFIADVRRAYDDAGRLTQDQQRVYVNGVPIIRNVNYPSHDDAGKLLRMYVDSVTPAYDYTFSYDNMGRFEKIQLTGNSFVFQYQYDPASNEKQRDNLFNGVSQIYPPDALNRTQYVDLKKGDTSLGHEGYAYDTASRLGSVTREDNKQDRFTYYKDGELNVATYGAVPTATPSPSPTITPPPGQVATPTFRPDGAYFADCLSSYTFNVIISTTTNGAQISYTTDGSTPTQNHGTIIANNGTAQIPVPAGQTKTVKAIGFKTGMAPSNVKSADYTFDRECGQGPMGYPLDNAGLPPAGPVAPDLTGTFTYGLDKAGNRTAVNSTSYSPNTINQYTSVGGAPVTNGSNHEIQTYGGFTYHYMGDQELKQITATGFVYDFAYDALGRCVKRTVNNATSTYYFYDGDKLILEYDGTNNGLVGFNVYGKGVDEIN
jgi:YD repeat-containing protein